jgi:hypothetical protein
MPNPSRFGACAAVEAVTIVHDLSYVTQSNRTRKRMKTE